MWGAVAGPHTRKASLTLAPPGTVHVTDVRCGGRAS